MPPSTLAQFQFPSVALVGLICGFFIFRTFLGSNKRLPPGPKAHPLVGNTFQLAEHYPWLQLSEWTVKYGSIIHLKVLGTHMVVLGSREIAYELLGKRSAIYSDRPPMHMARLSGYGNAVPIQHCGDDSKAQRKFINQEFSPSAIIKYQKIQERQARKLAQIILDFPEQLERQVKFHVGSIIMRTVYGYWLTGPEDPFLTNPLTAMANFSEAIASGVWLVDILPFVKYIPKWLPGTSFLSKSEQWKTIVMNTTYMPYEWSKEQILSGKSLEPNFSASIFNQNNGVLDPDVEHTLIWSTSSVMGGGMDNNMSTIMTFILAMILYPDVQRKAQQEIFNVIGDSVLPSLSDKPSLPYVQSLVTEVYRWHPSMPLGIPHCLTQDDNYNGMFLPKDTLVIPNVWHMMHDPQIFSDPEVFNPERYKGLDSEMQKVTDITFGFGRRRCPGFDFAQQSIFAIVATILVTCDILPDVETELPKAEYTSGGIVFPKPFKYKLQPRSDHMRQLLRSYIEEMEVLL
ncbi:hypothetical protein D9757_013345 [Collybiopsis confluens]|uniref:Cytochrome P450 n=1 Tax=Collybiopsis confluens TaxID=2823264 RepID=A0A8H5D896_9AGAR|nr:hypothetical protein D9757_013345 [Collybiopsis confluens]